MWSNVVKVKQGTAPNQQEKFSTTKKQRPEGSIFTPKVITCWSEFAH